MVALSKICTLKQANTAGAFRQWQAIAASQDIGAGLNLSITINQGTAGALPPAVADVLTLDIYVAGSSTLLRSFVLTSALGTQAVTLTMSATGLAAAAARSGTLRMRLHAVNTTGGPTGTYDIDSDLTNNTPVTTYTVTIHEQGWVRSTTTATTILAASTDLIPTFLAFGNTLTATTTLGAPPFDSRAVVITCAPLTAVSSTATTASVYVTALGTVDNRLTNGLATLATVTTFPNDTFTGSPWTAATQTEASRPVDPRFNKPALLQVTGKAYGSGPLTKDVGPSRNRLTSELGFLGTRYRNANNAGTNSLTTHHVLADQDGLVAAIVWDDTTGTHGGEDGWTGPTLQAWDSQLPGGRWTHTTTVTAPSNATGLETGSDPVNLLSRNFNAIVVAALSVTNEDDHAHAGDTLTASMYAYTSTTGVRIAPDDGTVKFSLTRLNRASGLMEALNTNLTTWSAWTTGVRPSFALIASTADPTLFQLALPATSDWGVSDIVEAQAVCVIGGGTYVGMVPRELLSAAANGHGKYEFDGAGFVGYPSK